MVPTVLCLGSQHTQVHLLQRRPPNHRRHWHHGRNKQHHHPHLHINPHPLKQTLNPPPPHHTLNGPLLRALLHIPYLQHTTKTVHHTTAYRTNPHAIQTLTGHTVTHPTVRKPRTGQVRVQCLATMKRWLNRSAPYSHFQTPQLC